MAAHIFVDDIGDYYRVADGLPTLPQGGYAVTVPDRAPTKQ